MKNKDCIKIALVDDNKLIRSLVRDLLEAEEDFDICGEADTLAQARQFFEAQCPDVILLDLSMEGTEGGLKFLKEISAMKLPVSVIILSAHDEGLYSERSFAAGAKGYVCKDKAAYCLADAVRSVYDGKRFISSGT